MTVRRSRRPAEAFRCLVHTSAATAALVSLESRLSGAGLLHKRRQARGGSGDVGIRLLVAKRHFDMAFRVLVELSAELAPVGFPGFVQRASALRSPAVGE